MWDSKWVTQSYATIGSFKVTRSFELDGVLPISNAVFKQGQAITVKPFIVLNSDRSVLYEVMVDGNSQGTFPTTETFTINSLSIGTHSLKLRVSSESRTVTVDRSVVISGSSALLEPNLAVLVPTSRPIIPSSQIPLMIVASDPAGQALTIRVTVAGVSAGRSYSGSIYPFSTGVFPPGQYALKAVATNSSGLTKSLSFTLHIQDTAFHIPTELMGLASYSVQKWNLDYLKMVYAPGVAPMSGKTPDYDGNSFAWNAGYYLRALVSMYQLTSSSYYIVQAKQIVDNILNNTDAKRFANGKYSFEKNAYVEGPSYVFAPNIAAKGWSRKNTTTGALTNLVLDDGHIAHHLMIYVDTVLSHCVQLGNLQTEARNTVATLKDILLGHDSMWKSDNIVKVTTVRNGVSTTINTLVNGSYYYSNKQGGTYNAAVAFNHSATVASAMLRINKYSHTPSFQDKVTRIYQYFKEYTWDLDGTAQWYYSPWQFETLNGPTEDFSHAHIDIEFLIDAVKFKVSGASTDILDKMANTYALKLFRSDIKSVWNRLDGTETPRSTSDVLSAGFGWLDLAELDPTVLDITLQIYQTQAPAATFDRSLLGWANILNWHSRLH